MKITFFSNFFNHHQAPLSIALNNMDGIDFYFIATTRVPEERLDLGYANMNKSHSFIICTYESNDAAEKARELADTSDIVIIGSASESYIKPRLLKGKLTFKYSERYFKNGLNWKTFINRFIHSILRIRRYQNQNLYFLCASAYTAADVNTFANFKNRCFKWGYFTKVDMNYKLEAPKPDASSSKITPLMWCARFLSWKHPELPIQLARQLKDKGYSFRLDMYGTGEKLEESKALAQKLDVYDVVHFCGSLPNEQILEQIKQHDIFLFTSDFNEGWGAVLNESMSCGCVPVASHAIGSVPFLIQDGENGLIYENENLDSLTNKVEYLLTHPQKRFEMRQKAIQTMQKQWNAENAAERFILLAKEILNGNPYPDMFKDGVCSKACNLSNNWYKN